MKVILCGVAVVATVLAVLYTVENWRGSRAWNAMEKKLQSQGVQLDFTKLVPPAVPAEQNFAMTPFLAPLYDFLPGTQEARDTNALARTTSWAKDFPGLNMTWRLGKRTDLGKWAGALEQMGKRGEPDPHPTNGNPADPAAARTVLERLQPYQPVLEELRTASARPQSRFGIRYEHEDPPAILLPHLSRLRLVTQMLAVRASAQLALRRSDMAVEDLMLAFVITDSVRTEPYLISQLVRGADLQTSLQILWDGLCDHRWDDAQLDRILGQLKSRDLVKDLQFSVEAERVWGNAIIQRARQNPSYLIQLGGTDGVGLAAVYVDLYQALLGWIPRGWISLEQVNYHRLYGDLFLAEMPHPLRTIPPARVKKMEENLNRELSGKESPFLSHTLLARMLLPAMPNVYKRFAMHQNSLDEAMIACALERFRLKNGKYPASLQELSPNLLASIPVDVTTGGPLKYRLEPAGGYVLYSPGWNEKDDGGTVADRKGEWEANAGDWVWSQP
jgi:hypothetical protein